MTETRTAGSPALYSGPFNTLHSLGIFIAVITSPFIRITRRRRRNMLWRIWGSTSFTPTAKDGTTSRPMGWTSYSLVYTPGEQGRLDHISYMVRSADDLLAAEKRLRTHLSVKSERIERSQLWRHGPALRFTSPGGHMIEMVPGVPVDVPMAALVAEPQTRPHLNHSTTQSSARWM